MIWCGAVLLFVVVIPYRALSQPEYLKWQIIPWKICLLVITAEGLLPGKLCLEYWTLLTLLG